MDNAQFTIFGVKIGLIRQISQLIIKTLVVDARVHGAWGKTTTKVVAP